MRPQPAWWAAWGTRRAAGLEVKLGRLARPRSVVQHDDVIPVARTGSGVSTISGSTAAVGWSRRGGEPVVPVAGR